MESPCECGIEPPGSISHGVSLIYIEERNNAIREKMNITNSVFRSYTIEAAVLVRVTCEESRMKLSKTSEWCLPLRRNSRIQGIEQNGMEGQGRLENNNKPLGTEKYVNMTN